VPLPGGFVPTGLSVAVHAVGRRTTAPGLRPLGSLGVSAFFGGLFGADFVGFGLADFAQLDFDLGLVTGFVFAFFAFFFFFFRFAFERFFDRRVVRRGRDGAGAVCGAGREQAGKKKQGQ